ncbi:MAG: hypothetical protein PVI75_08070 [Gammaproteobacteria bacterium]|jgi:hypothetical protein
MSVHPACHRAEAISYFSLSYFIGVYVFPVIVGWIIVHYGYQISIVVVVFLAILDLLCALVFK